MGLRMSDCKKNILASLARNNNKTDKPEPYLPAPHWQKDTLIEHFIANMKANRTEIQTVKRKIWLQWLHSELVKREVNNILVGSNQLGVDIHDKINGAFDVFYYQDAIDSWKENLFLGADVGITGCKGAVADTGSIILWPDHAEPRLLSLAPPTHIAIIDSNDIYENFAQAMQQQSWVNGMPSNALLVSGPSKTADIEQTLAYGIHGPQSLVVAVLVD